MHFRTEFRWLQEVTGPSRDLDVYLHEFDEFRELLAQQRRDDLEPLRTLLSAQRARERRRMVRALRSTRTAMLLEDWRALLAGLEHPGPPTAPDAALPIVTVAAARIGKVFRQIVKAGSAIDDSSPHEALHELRKRCKELRYLLEFFATLYPAEVTKPMVRTLKDLQDTLGRFQDREVQAELIRSLGDEVGALADGTGRADGDGTARGTRGGPAGRGPRGVRGAFRRVRRQEAAQARAGGLRVTPVLATYNIKGGVGKTSAAVNLAYLAAQDGARTLLWDLDPQGASTYLFRVKPKVKGGGHALVRGKRDISTPIKGTDIERLDLLPADFSYRHLDLELDATKRPTRRLARLLAPLGPSTTRLPGLPAEHLAASPRASSRPPTRCWSP